MMVCAHLLAATPGRSRGCGPTTCWRRSSRPSSKKSPFDPTKIEDVVVGCANQAGEDSRCVGRHAGLLAGLPIEVAGSVLQRNCGSGLNAIVMAAQAVTCGEGEVFVAGGVESMSRAPFVMNKAETPFSRDGRVFDFDDRRALSEPEDRAPVRRRYDA